MLLLFRVEKNMDDNNNKEETAKCIENTNELEDEEDEASEDDYNNKEDKDFKGKNKDLNVVEEGN